MAIGGGIAPVRPVILSREFVMATLASETRIVPNKVGMLRFSVTGALASAIFFILCWLGAQLSIGPASHMYIQLFTDEHVTSGLALLQGACWSLLFGLLTGGLIAFFYNILASLDGREL